MKVFMLYVTAYGHKGCLYQNEKGAYFVKAWKNTDKGLQVKTTILTKEEFFRFCKTYIECLNQPNPVIRQIL